MRRKFSLPEPRRTRPSMCKIFEKSLRFVQIVFNFDRWYDPASSTEHCNEQKLWTIAIIIWITLMLSEFQNYGLNPLQYVKKLSLFIW